MTIPVSTVNYSVFRCHCDRKGLKLQVRTLVFPSLQQDKLLLAILSGERVKISNRWEGRETNYGFYWIVQEVVYPSKQDPILGQTDERVGGIWRLNQLEQGKKYPPAPGKKYLQLPSKLWVMVIVCPNIDKHPWSGWNCWHHSPPSFVRKLYGH